MKKVILIPAFLLALLSCFVAAFFAYYFSVTKGVKLDAEKLSLESASVCVYDCNGEEVAVASSKGKAEIGDLPAYLSGAFVAVEDKRFYSHGGFDYKRIAKAMMKNVASFSFREGASTISQQLIKNTHLTGEKTVKRKLKEYKLTRALEKNYTKEDILECYLNTIYFGHNAFGIENASKFYFGKSASAVTPAESAMLAALIKSPNRYSPFRDAEKCLSRRNFVLSLMKEQALITPQEYETAIQEPLPLEPAEENDFAGSYLSLVYDELSQIFPDAKTGELTSLKVYTALDSQLQKKMEETNADSDVCMLVRGNGNNTIKALYSTAGTPKRLPASTIKPLLVYAPALQENLISPATPVLDEKINFSGYSPTNYDKTYGGYMSVRYALSHSVNVPAVKILNELGVEKGCDYLRRMNLPVEKDDYSLALALGGMKEGFPLTALADAYSVFPRGGYFTPSKTILRIENAQGKVLYELKQNAVKVFDEDVCSLMNNMLYTTVQEGTAKTLKALPFPVCAKTGTGGNAAGNTDAYTVAYTKDDVIAVWLGNRDNSPVQTTGGGLPANYALNVLRALYQTHTPDPIPVSENVTEVLFDKEEYENNHRILLADPASPPITQKKDLFRKCALPTEKSKRFSLPTIQNPTISVKNGSVCIELCQTQYYDYIVKRKNNGEEITVYSGKYRKYIYDNSVQAGKSYIYTVIPVYQNTQGVAVELPSVSIQEQPSLPDDWWE